MNTIYFTITGTCFRHGHDFLERGDKVKLVKEPDNKYDTEAIKVEMPAIGQIGYVANSPRTVVGECYSAGRIYDKIDDIATGLVYMIMSDAVICELKTMKPETINE